MSKPKPIHVPKILLMALMVSGCGTPVKQSTTTLDTEPDNVFTELQTPNWLPTKLPYPGWKPNPDGDYVGYKGQPPVWLFIPSVSHNMEDQSAGGFPAEIAQPGLNHTTNRIQVTVQGRVRLPGMVSMAEGGTVLEAISLAGGFGEAAFTKRVRITKRDKRQYLIFLHFRRAAVSGHRVAWYGNQNWDGDESNTDYVLEDGDKVEIQMHY